MLNDFFLIGLAMSGYASVFKKISSPAMALLPVWMYRSKLVQIISTITGLSFFLFVGLAFYFDGLSGFIYIGSMLGGVIVGTLLLGGLSNIIFFLYPIVAILILISWF